MKIIDEKGRIFGRINVIDFLVILFLFCLIPMFYFGYKILNRPPVVAKKGIFTSIDINVVFKNLSSEEAKLVTVGDKEMDGAGNIIGEILEVGTIESNFIDIDLGSSGIITKEDHQRKQVSVKLRLIGKLEGNDIFYKTDKVKIDFPISFKTSKYEAQGVIIPKPSKKVGSFGAEFSTINLDLLFGNLNPEVAKLIAVDDFEVDKDGNTLAKILSVGRPEPYSYKMDLGGGNYITRTDPQKRQILAKMEIMGRIEGNAFYFKDKRIAIDSTVEFSTNKYNIKGAVTKEPSAIKKIDRKWVVLKVEFEELMPELAALINEGDEERYFSGELVAKIISILSNQPAEIVVSSQDGRLNIAQHPRERDVVVSMKVHCIKAQKGLFFKENRVKVGANLFLQTERYDINGIIIEINETED